MQYRLIFFRYAMVIGWELIDAENAFEAVKIAASRNHQHSIEIWHENERIARIGAGKNA